MTGRDHYAVLGVPRGASGQDIRRAYRTLALRYHPDVYSGTDAGLRFREIADAYEVLQDPARRTRYDAISRSGRDEDDDAAAWGAGHRSRDVPRFVDEDAEPHARVDDPIGALLGEMLSARPAAQVHAWVRSGEPRLRRRSWSTGVG